jgi:drug/metabolite transporter (DMT)-like permease
MSDTPVFSSPRPTTTAWRHQALLFAGVFVGATASLFTRIAQEEGIPTPYIVAFRMMAGALALTPFVLRFHRNDLRHLQRRDILFAALAGFWFAVYLTAGFAALEHTTILVASVLSGTVPLWIALMETTFMRTHLSSTVWAGLVLTLAGGTLIAISGMREVHPGNNPPLGIVLGIVSALSGALYLVIGRKSRDVMPFLPYMWLLFVFGGLTALMEVAIVRAPAFGYSGKGYLALILLVLLPQLTTHTIFNYSVRFLPATFIGAANQLGVVIAAVLAYFFFGEIPTALQIPGSLAIIVGILLVSFWKPHAK